MRDRFRIVAAAAVLVFTTIVPAAQQPVASATESAEYGPAKGTLVIVGGGNLTGSGISEKFIELAGGVEKKFVIVPTAGGNRNARGELVAYDEQRDHRPVAQARGQARADAAHARSEGGRHRGLRRCGA